MNMKQIILSIFFSHALFAKSSLLSPIPPVQSIFLDIDAKKCNMECLQEYLDNGEFFSFLAKYENYSGFDDMQKTYEELTVLFNIKKESLAPIKVALLVPQKTIGRYSIATANSILSYLIFKKRDFIFEVFNCINEDQKSITEAIKKIEDKNFRFVIAPVTNKGAKIIAKSSTTIIFYIPTVNEKFINLQKPNIYYGGIDYEEQIQKLEFFANERIAIFKDGSELSNNLTKMVEENFENIVYKANIKNSKTNFKSLLKKNKKLQNATIFLNTPLVKSSLIASQLRYYKIEPYSLLSTQINYHPVILTLTQHEDRKNFFIANSITEPDFELNEINSILRNSIYYDWINYSTSIGVDYIFSTFIDRQNIRKFSEPMESNQIKYQISIVKPALSQFEDASR